MCILFYQSLCGQFIFISSASAYDKPPKRLPIDESAPLHPFWRYSRDKIFAGLYMEAFRARHHTTIRAPLTLPTGNGHLGLRPRQHRSARPQGKPLIVQRRNELWTVTHGGLRLWFRWALWCARRSAAFHISRATLWNEILNAKCAAAGRRQNPRDTVGRALSSTGFGRGLWETKPPLFDQSKLKRFVLEVL